MIRVNNNNTFTTISAALNSLPQTFLEDYLIEILDNGVYQEVLVISSFNTNGFQLTIAGVEGTRPTIDNNFLSGSAIITSGVENLLIRNIRFINADIENESGAIIRCNNVKNHTYEDLELNFGFCGFRGTDQLENCTFKNILIKNVTAGTFRLGDGLNPYPDLKNILIEDIKFDHSSTNPIITGTSNRNFGPGLVLKSAENLIVKNIRSLNGIQYDMGVIEQSVSPLVENFKGTYLKIIDCENTLFKNVDLLEQGIYLENSIGFSAFHCTLGDINMVLSQSITELKGCIFPKGLTLNIASPQNFGTESHNAFGVNISQQYIAFYYSDGTPPLIVNDFSLNNWQLSQGAGSVYSSNPDDFLRNNEGYLLATSIGIGLVPNMINGITTDITGHLRSFPTDAGAYETSLNNNPMNYQDIKNFLSERIIGQTAASSTDIGNAIKNLIDVIEGSMYSRTLVDFVEPVTNDGSENFILCAYNVPGNLLSKNGDKIRFKYNGYFASNDISKVFRFQGILGYTFGGTQANGKSWTIEGTFTRLGTSGGKIALTRTVSGEVPFVGEFIGFGDIASDWPFNLLTTSASGSITFTHGYIDFIPGASNQ
ncbi:hypothetical protein [Pedobacter glucosidilyticus]|uniref:hypothetical protein n=1 Tax=Pedobacter glucosidilyticus TaxID=1122941 RepID=UPI000413DFC1|nr:hypothetical protein [Pedobacter glucosidilyticus]